LAGGADVNSTAADGSTALHWAAHRDDLAMVDALLSTGAKADMASRYNVVPLTLAAQNGSVAMVQRLLKAGASPDSVSEEGQTALMTAARNGCVEVVRVLLAAGAKIQAAEEFRGQTALMFAAGEGNTGAVDLLLEFGADLKVKSKAGLTPLLFAVRNNRYETAKYLLERGANPNDALPDGTAALNMAMLNADFDLAAMLLDKGADPNHPDPRGHPLHVAVWLHKPGAPPDFAMNGLDPQPVAQPSGKMNHLDIAKKLLEKGADVNALVTIKDGRFAPGGGLSRNPQLLQIGRHYLSYEGATPFYLAARNGDIAMRRVLVAAGADPNKPTKHGVTPLMAAACLDYYEGETAGPYSGVPEAERLEAVKFTVELGNDVNARTNFGDYPMTGTAADTLLRYPDNIQDLRYLGVGDVRFNQMTPLHGAVLCNQPSIVEYLISRGAALNAKNQLGWTPLTIAGGFFISNNKKEFPAVAEILRKAMTAGGIPVE
jgi:ankyrin repeat protein